ncbi:unnamed protein product, partial [Penicillium egyptiacum]
NLGQYGWVQMRRKRDAGVRNEMGSGPDLFVMPESDFMRPNEGLAGHKRGRKPILGTVSLSAKASLRPQSTRGRDPTKNFL